MKKEILAAEISGKQPKSITDNEDFYHAVLESMEDYAVFTTDTNGVVNSWNSGAERVLGYREKDIIGRSFAVIFTAEDQQREEPAKELNTALKYGRALDERFHLRKDGSKFWASGKVFPLYDSKEVHIGFTKVMRNLTERMRAQEQLQAARQYAEGIIEWAVEPIVILNDDLTVSAANKAFFKQFNVKKKKSFNIPLDELTNGEFDDPEFVAILKHLKNGPGNVRNVEITNIFKKDGGRIFLVNGHRLRPDVNINLFMLSIQDVTEQRTLERQKDDFISIASHEIRTPLTVIKATAQLLELRFQESGFVEKSALKISEKTDKLLMLINYLLDAAQISNSKLVMKPESFSMERLVAESVEEMLMVHPELSIIVKGKFNGNIIADRFRISQVLNNLLNNAFKYSPPEKNIIIKLGKNKAGDLLVSVQDFGIGIPKQEQKNLFKRFWRASTAKGKNVQGVGLGLYISSQIIKGHNGRLWFKSEKNKGSTFKFSLPVNGI
jgi:PAS domain S-box-containing protein